MPERFRFLSLFAEKLWKYAVICIFVFVFWFGHIVTASAQQIPSGVFCVPEAQSMPLTPNSNSVVSPLQDINKNVLVVLQTGGITYWTAMLSTSTATLVLASNQGNAIVSFQAGLNVSMQVSGNQYQIMLSGPIFDSGTQYQITGKLLAIVTCSMEKKPK